MFHPGMHVCMPYHWESDAHEIFQYLSETILGFLLPFTFILFCYISVICRLRSAMFQRKGRGNALILIIIAAFLVFWLPYHLINILQVSDTSHSVAELEFYTWGGQGEAETNSGDPWTMTENHSVAELEFYTWGGQGVAETNSGDP